MALKTAYTKFWSDIGRVTEFFRLEMQSMAVRTFHCHETQRMPTWGFMIWATSFGYLCQSLIILDDLLNMVCLSLLIHLLLLILIILVLQVFLIIIHLSLVLLLLSYFLQVSSVSCGLLIMFYLSLMLMLLP